MIVVDVGDALLANPAAAAHGEGELNKAATIMQAHGLIGMDAMAVGEAELAIGPARLASLARQASLTLLCANLADARGRRPFAERKLVEAGGTRVGLFAVLELPQTPPEISAPLRAAKLHSTDAVAAARAQVQALRAAGAELVVMLAHTGMPRAKEIATQVPGIHVALVAHSAFRTSTPERVGQTYLVEPGRRGQELGQVELRLGDGWSATTELADDSPRHALYDEASAEAERVRKGLAASPGPEVVRGRILPQAERVRQLAERLAAAKPPAAPHTLIARLIELDESWADQPAVRGLILSQRASWSAGGPPVPIAGPLRAGSVRAVPTSKLRLPVR